MGMDAKYVVRLLVAERLSLVKVVHPTIWGDEPQMEDVLEVDQRPSIRVDHWSRSTKR